MALSEYIVLRFYLVQMNPTLVPNYKRILDKVNIMLSCWGEPMCVKIVAEISNRNFTNQIDSKKVAGFIMFMSSWYIGTH